MKIIPKIEVREAKDIVDFATTMDSDMNQYFEEKEEILKEVPRRKSALGVVFTPAIVNSELFYAYLLKGKEFKDGTCIWKLCISCKENEDAYIHLFTIRGTEKGAKEKLERILVTGHLYD